VGFLDECVHVKVCNVSDGRKWDMTLLYLARVVCIWCIAVVVVSAVFIMVRLVLLVGCYRGILVVD
jgi:hypothetical protein